MTPGPDQVPVMPPGGTVVLSGIFACVSQKGEGIGRLGVAAGVTIMVVDAGEAQVPGLGVKVML